MSKLRIREIFRYPSPLNISTPEIDGYRNHFYVTDFPNHASVKWDSGIAGIAEVNTVDGKRRPAILIRSNPFKGGTEATPWQDVFDVDNGHIRYYGDNKTPGKDPALASGNKILLSAFETYNNIAKRHDSVPLIFYKAVSRNNKIKGFLEFNGFGIIKGVELITQYDRKLDRTFSNYAFNFHVFSLAESHEEFDWNWINDRRNKKLSLKETLENAPVSWTEWLKKGNRVLEKYRRRVSKLLTISSDEQKPKKGSREERTLKNIYKFYHKKKSRFEALSAAVAAKIIRDEGGNFFEGWITPASSDGGADFYGRIEIGNGFGKAKLILLGQAKCEGLNSATGGNHIARTVARLRRGWVGAYVTTSYFSEAVQREIIEDEYPIMLINGLKLAETVLKILHDEGYPDLKKFLDELDSKYDDMVQIRRADELLLE
ncbi:MAG TPA: restriction endonuclease [Bacteroidia bacterium]|nr:restriction endonuclease [Bacteroidia bacterium]